MISVVMMMDHANVFWDILGLTVMNVMSDIMCQPQLMEKIPVLVSEKFQNAKKKLCAYALVCYVLSSLFM